MMFRAKRSCTTASKHIDSQSGVSILSRLFPKGITLALTIILSSSIGVITTAGVANARPAGITDDCGPRFGNADWDDTFAESQGRLVDHLLFQINVGGDDIRGGTVVSAIITDVFNGTTQMNLNVGQERPNSSTFVERFVFPRDWADRGVHPPNITSITITYTSGQPDWFSTPDNWNLTGIKVFFPKNVDVPIRGEIGDINSQYDQWITGSGDPYLHRFKQNCEEKEGSPNWTITNPNR